MRGKRLRDPHAERVVLCGLLKEHELVLPRLLDLGLTADDFAVHVHGLVYGACLDLAATGDGVVGPHSLYLVLTARRQWAELGPDPFEWVAGVWDCDPTGAWAVPSARRVVWLSTLRRAVYAARELERDAADGVLTPHDPRLAVMGVTR